MDWKGLDNENKSTISEHTSERQTGTAKAYIL
jgi:hypothetical protein